MAASFRPTDGGGRPPPPLIDTAGLRALLGDPATRIVDARWYLGRPGEGRAAYERGHVPGAIHLDLDDDLSVPGGPGRHPLPDPAAFARRMGGAGIGVEHRVVAYDDAGGWVGARLWWMLERLGHPWVRVLDGGIGAWMAARGPLVTEVPAWPEASFEPRSGWSGTIDRDELRRRLGTVVLLDARAAARYRGEVEPIDPAAGHIPTALSAPYEQNLGPDGRFLPVEALAARFQDLGADGTTEVVTYCGSGTSALHHALAMRLLGLPDPTLYVGSWSDWSTAAYPVATGPEPGEPG